MVSRSPGKERDSETGLDYSLFRQYASTMGRWLSPDPLGGNASNPQNLNRYAYVLNNPLRFIDPLGLMWCKGTSGCVSDEEYEKHKDKYQGYEKTVHIENVTVTEKGDFQRLPPFLAVMMFRAAGPPRRLSTGGAFINSQAYMNAMSQAFQAFPTVTGGGAFLYGGYEFELPYVGEIELVGLAEYDSNEGLSAGGLFAIGGHGFSIGADAMAGKQGLRTDYPMYFVGGNYGGFVQTQGFSRRITAIGAYAGRFSPVPKTGRKLGGGGGAYLSIR